jgi:hypothetical protein
MNFDPAYSEELNFEPTYSSRLTDSVGTFVAESSIVRTIVQGSGGPDNVEITDQGLRFVRHLLSTSNLIKQDSVPNFKDMDTIRELAREFIKHSGNPTNALQVMYRIMMREERL